MNKPHLILSYTYNAVSFLFDKQLQKKINALYLFGSATREEMTEESDIDLFIHCEKQDEDFIQKRAELNISKFYKSKDFEKWKQLNIQNPISITAGNLKKWALKTSIQSEGLTLYKAASVSEKELEKKVLLVFEFPEKKSIYLKFKRDLFGRKEYTSPGFIKEIQGEHISKKAIIIPQLYLTKAKKFFQKYKINYKLIQFLTYPEI